MASKQTKKKMEQMFNGELPIVKAEVVVGIKKIPAVGKNYDFDIEYVKDEIDVEVLTVNFGTGGMRVRYIASIYSEEDEIRCVDIDNKPFLDKYMSSFGDKI